MSALVLIDWENISRDLREAVSIGPIGFSLKSAFIQTLNWIVFEANGIFDLFLFSPLHLVSTDSELFSELGIVPMACPKMTMGRVKKRDTVDRTLIKKGEKWVTHQEVTHLCLLSGDSDFIPMIKTAKALGRKIMISALDPKFAKDPKRPFLSKTLAKLADVSQITGYPMIHYFSPMEFTSPRISTFFKGRGIPQTA
jgi:hypothetical protein